MTVQNNVVKFACLKNRNRKGCMCLFMGGGSPLEPECLGWDLGLPIFQLCDSKSDSQIRSGNDIILLRIVKINTVI